MKLILVSSPIDYSPASIISRRLSRAGVDTHTEVSIVKEALAMGVEAFHLRKKSWGFEESQNFLANFNENELTKISIHGPLGWPIMLGLRRVHFKDNLKEISDEEDKFTESIEEIRTTFDVVKISRSFHQIDDLRFDAHKYDLAFLSPIWNSISKEGYDTPFDLDKLKGQLSNMRIQHIKNDQSIDLYALGGIDEDKISQAQELGFDGVAVLGCVWQSNDPIKKIKTLLAECTRVQKKSEDDSGGLTQ